MTAPLDPRQTWWEDEGGRIAGRLREVSALVVTGTDLEIAARVALGIAYAESEQRHVALGDLAGDLAPLYAIAGGEDAFGLSDCLRQGLPLNDIARPAPGRESLFILPAGSPPLATEEIVAHERWPRLVNGFAKAGALLILVAPLDAPGIETLVAATGGVVLVDTPAARAGKLPVLATVQAPQAEPRVSARRTEGWRRLRIWTTSAIAIVVAVAAVSTWYARHRQSAPRSAAPRPIPALAAAPAATPSPPRAEPADTVRLIDPVNPADTSSTVPFAVEVMAANTLAGANSFLSDNGKELAFGNATVSPVAVGAADNVWYKVVVGASHDRAGADSILALLRTRGLVRKTEGRVVKVPYALLLAENIEQANITAFLHEHPLWTRGFNPYLLVQSDGGVRVLAGAFETAAQAAPLASALRAAGVAPVLAFRTGRTY